MSFFDKIEDVTIVSMASHLLIYRNYAYQWRVLKDVIDCNLHRLDVHRAAKSADVNWPAASPFIGPLYGYVCTPSIARWKARGRLPIRHNSTFLAISYG